MVSFTYSIIRNPNRKTASLSVSPDNKVTIIVPENLKNEDVQKIIENKSHWVNEKIRFNKQVKYPYKSKEYVSGEAIVYTGRNFRLKILEVC